MQHREHLNPLITPPFTFVLQVAPLLRLLVGLSLVLCESVLQHHLVLLKQRHACFHGLPQVRLWQRRAEQSSCDAEEIHLFAKGHRQKIIWITLHLQIKSNKKSQDVLSFR